MALIYKKQKEYQAKESVNSNDEKYTSIQYHVIKALEGTKEKIKEITSISKIESRQTNFYVIDAETENGNHRYIVAQDKFTNELDYPQKIR